MCRSLYPLLHLINLNEHLFIVKVIYYLFIKTGENFWLISVISIGSLGCAALGLSFCSASALDLQRWSPEPPEEQLSSAVCV